MSSHVSFHEKIYTRQNAVNLKFKFNAIGPFLRFRVNVCMCNILLSNEISGAPELNILSANFTWFHGIFNIPSRLTWLSIIFAHTSPAGKIFYFLFISCLMHIALEKKYTPTRCVCKRPNCSRGMMRYQVSLFKFRFASVEREVH